MYHWIRNYSEALRGLRKFKALPPASRQLVFYAEDGNSAVYFEPIIRELLRYGQKISYLTSCRQDPILSARDERINAFYIGEGFLRVWFFLTLDASVLVMTMPDLETFSIKRSKVRSVHYVYIFHSMVSTHMIYRKAAFDHFDSIFCVGPHHVDEIRKAEQLYGLKSKRLIEHGYGRLDMMLGLQKQLREDPSVRKILVAPSWGDRALLEVCGKELVGILIDAGFSVTVRPHPMTLKKSAGVIEEMSSLYGENARFELERGIRSQDSFFRADLMISDWSGAALEFAFGLERPVLFVDIPKKVNCPDYEAIQLEPIEVSLREKLGGIVSVRELHRLPEIIDGALQNADRLKVGMKELRNKTVYNVGRSGEIAAKELMQLIT